MAFPDILLAVAIMAVLGPQPINVVIAVTIAKIPTMARIVRSSALVVKEQTYIEAMKSQGASSFRIIWRHIVPNVMSPLIVQTTYVFAIAIILEAALSFLGAGIPAPDPSWGNILYDGKIVIFSAWWMTVFPGVFIILAVLGLNLFGDGLRDLLDPHSSKANK
jgi:peptide/nickel transport system permease protein